MFKVGDTIRWMCPLDHDYTYGKILNIDRSIATVQGIGLYKHIITEVHLRYIEKYTGGKRCGGGKRGTKSFSTKSKL